jgi:hypothetical protein
LIFILAALTSGMAFSQKAGIVSPGVAGPSPAGDSIRAAALDYAGGFCSGDAGRMKNANHFDINKAFPRYIAKTGQVSLTYSTYSMLVEMCAAKTGYKPDTARHISMEILQPPSAGFGRSPGPASDQLNEKVRLLRRSLVKAGIFSITFVTNTKWLASMNSDRKYFCFRFPRL